MASALDRERVSTLTLICAAIAGAIGENINGCSLSTSKIYRRRSVHRDRIATLIKYDFTSSVKSNLVLPWEGKKLLDTTNESIELRNKNGERLAIVVSGSEWKKILTITKTAL